MRTYELKPTGNQKSFYGKAYVEVDGKGTETLYSYGTPIITRTASGDLRRHYDSYTATTGKHIKAFCGLDKAAFMKLSVEERIGRCYEKTSDLQGNHTAL